jgi:hypothetical protein
MRRASTAIQELVKRTILPLTASMIWKRLIPPLMADSFLLHHLALREAGLRRHIVHLVHLLARVQRLRVSRAASARSGGAGSA